MGFQYLLPKMEYIQSLGIEITWEFLRLGLIGDTPFSQFFSPEEIIEYAQEKLAYEPVDDKVIQLAIQGKEDVLKIDALLRELAQGEGVFKDLEHRKWKALYLSCRLKERADHISGLCELAEIWQQIGTPTERSYYIQGVGNEHIPQNFYTVENYKMLFLKSKEVLDTLLCEIKTLKKQKDNCI